MKRAVIAVASTLALSVTMATLSAPVLASPGRPGAVPRGAVTRIDTQQAEVRGDAGAVGFGQTLAISGTTLVVGAPDDASGGRAGVGLVYVFTRTSAGWHQSGELQGTDTFANDGFGQSVAISGPTVVVGATGYGSRGGHVYVFARQAAGWRQAAELQGGDTVGGDGFGKAVAISGNTIVVGAAAHPRGGRAYVFSGTAGGWRQTAELAGTHSGPYDGFGGALAVSGGTVVVSALLHAGLMGVLDVFSDTAHGWRLTAELSGPLAKSYFGKSVAISANIIVAGATGSPSGTGWAYVFTKTASGWHRTGALENLDAAPRDYFGQSVAISGSTIVVGAALQSRGGRAYTFAGTAAGWRQTGELMASDAVPYDWFGSSLAVSGTDVVVGAPYYPSAGRAYVFQI
jgi:hypothetical protein